MTIVIMGVSGSGKTTVGELLAERLGWPFYDADNFHPPANREKMSHSIPLTDEDRIPWLEALQRLIHENQTAGQSIVLACSALKESYRQILSEGNRSLQFVLLTGDREVIARRITHRKGHFMPASLLDSQLATLEEPEHALIADVSKTPEEIVGTILHRFEGRVEPHR